MATTLDLLNKVLIGLRKTPIASGETAITDQHHLMLLQFINRSKRKVETAWDWQALRETVTVTLASGQSDYDLTIAEDADKDVGPRSRLLYENPLFYGYETTTRVATSRAQAFDAATGARLREAPWEHLERQYMTSNTSGSPSLFALRRTATHVQLKVWPLPNSAGTVKMRFVIPQPDLPADDLTETLRVPADDAVWLDALHMANAERGEELGAPNSALSEDAHAAMYEHIVAERTPYDDTGYPE